MKVIVPTVNATIGRFQDNRTKVEETLHGVSLLSSDALLVLHPYTLAGCEPQDAWEHPLFLSHFETELATMAKGATNAVSLIWQEQEWLVAFKYASGTLRKMPFNSSGYLLHEGMHMITDQGLMDTDLEPLAGEDGLWIVFMLDAYSREGVALLQQRAQMLAQQSGSTVVLVGALGTANDRLFSGDVALISNAGWGYGFLLEDQCTMLDTDNINIAWQVGKQQVDILESLVSREYALILFALRDFVQKSGFSKVHLGLSGGVDSALVATLAVHALGAEQVVGILMPSPHSSEHSVSDALALANNLGIEHHTISISPSYSQLQGELASHFTLSTLADENMQARLRGLYLMTYANSTGSFLLTTGNKSEIACGYGTLYGDMCGSYNPIGDLYKTEVYALCHYINEQAGKALIPEHILTKAPSAELREGQFDQESLPAYDRLDRIIEELSKNQSSLEEVVAKSNTTTDEVTKVAQLLRNSEFKRWQAAPVLKLSTTHMGSSRVHALLSRFRIDES